MIFDILTLFPDMLKAVLDESIIGRAQKNGLLTVNCINIRDFTQDKHRRVDDYPYGGGLGMVMQAPPIYSAYKSITDNSDTKPLVVYMSPQGMIFNQRIANSLAKEEHLIILCGHYEGVDERVIEEIVDMELSIGDFVLTGGEIPAAAVVDAVGRLVPGVLKEDGAFLFESHQNGLLEYPQYTRPPEFLNRSVPEVLLNGHHANIEAWRHRQSLLRTLKKRPDMLKKLELTETDRMIINDYTRGKEMD